MASIIYALIASDSNTTPLVEASLAEGNFSMLALKLLSKLKKNTSASYVYENKYIFHYNNDSEVTFLCMTDAAFNNRTAYAFLFEIKEKFFEKYGDGARNMPGYGANKDFSYFLKGKMHFYNSDQGGNDKIKMVRENIEKTKDIMIENIDKVLARGERIELLVNKTHQLSDSSVNMRKSVIIMQATHVKRFMWCKNAKITALLVFIVMVRDMQVILFFIVVFSCGGFSFSKC